MTHLLGFHLETLNKQWESLQMEIHEDSTIYVIIPYEEDWSGLDLLNLQYSIFPVDPSTLTLSGSWDIESTVSSSTDTNVFPVGTVFRNECFLRYNSGGNLEVYDFLTVDQDYLDWDSGLLELGDSGFSGYVNGRYEAEDRNLYAGFSSGTFDASMESGTLAFGERLEFPDGSYVDCFGTSAFEKDQ
ncbi:MAG: hypothetical protein JW760_14915 [Spirochaetales bacterium]|nr:hypothetical protein [Spirochaetales bacterium]